MKIGVYIEHGVGNGVGGAELAMAHLAAEWARGHDVDLIHHRPPLTRERIESFSQEDYRRVTFRCLPREPEPVPATAPWTRLPAAREWHRALSAGYDLFVNCTHWLPPFCHARAGALLVLFPFYVRPHDAPEIERLALWKRARHAAYYELEWQLRMATYRHRFAISEFSRAWTRRRWGIDCDVVYPPVDVDFPDAPKDPLILSVGRFSTLAHTKKQLEMMHAFRGLAGTVDGWTYACVGGLNTRAENHSYFQQVRQAAQGLPATVEANLDRPSIRGLFSRARIFWHATGLNDDTAARPELAEHFGIATAEAMAAGCVPVVIDKGGQREIVTHGKTGFLWNTLDELRAYTQRLMADPGLWQDMSAAARRRATLFTRARFVERLSHACRVPLQPPRGVERNAPRAFQPTTP